MNNTKTYIVGAIAVIALLIGIWAKTTPVEQVASTFGAISNTNAPAANTQVDGGALLPNPSVYDYLVARTYLYFDKALGFGNGTSVPTQMQEVRMSLLSGTSTPCALANPFTATSTVESFTMNITTATSSAITWAVGTSTTQYATSTSMLTQTVAAGAQQTLAYNASNGSIISSGSYVLAGTGAGTTLATGAFANGVVITGSCQALFETAN